MGSGALADLMRQCKNYNAGYEAIRLIQGFSKLSP